MALAGTARLDIANSIVAGNVFVGDGLTADDIIVVDCGVGFPEEDQLGIDLTRSTATASASKAVLATLLCGSWAVSETPAVWVWKRIHCARSSVTPIRPGCGTTCSCLNPTRR